MTTNFPGSLDSFVDPVNPGSNFVWLDGSIRDSAGTIVTPANPALVHTTQHDNINDAMAAVQAKLGVDNSVVTTSIDYLLKNASSLDPGHKHTASSLNAAGSNGEMQINDGGAFAGSETFYDVATDQFRIGTQPDGEDFIDTEKLLVSTAIVVVLAPASASGSITLATDVCSNPSFTTEATCLGAGTCSIPAYDNDQAACEAAYECSNPSLTTEATCLAEGTCSGAVYDGDQTACEAAGGTYDTGTNTCSLAVYDNDSAACSTAGGTFTSAGNTWNQGVFTSAGNTWGPDFTSSYTDDGSTVTIRVYAVKDGIYSPDYIETSVTFGSSGVNAYITWTWSASTGATGYRVLRSTDGENFTDYQDITGTSFDDYGDSWLGGNTVTPNYEVSEAIHALGNIRFKGKILGSLNTSASQLTIGADFNTSNPLATNVIHMGFNNTGHISEYGAVFGNNNIIAQTNTVTVVGHNNQLSVTTGNENTTVAGIDNTLSGDAKFCNVLGWQNTLSARLCSVVGQQNGISGARSAAVGTINTVSGENSVAIGYQCTVTGANAFAVGAGAQATAAQSGAIGNAARATSANVIAICSASTTSTGTDVRIQGQSSSTTRDIATMTTSWATATDASRKGRAVFNVYDTAAREAIRIEASGSAPMIGFLGASAVTRPNVTGSRGGNAALANLLTAIASTGLITNSTSA